MDRVGDVRPHAAVQVLGGVHRPLAALGGLPLGHPGRVGGVAAGVEAPRRVLPRDPHRLDVDGGVGRPQHGALEGAERPAELLAGVEVGRRLVQRRLAHADLQRAQPDGGGHEHEVEGGAPERRGRRGRRPAPRRTPARCRCGWISRLVVTARSSVTPGARGSTRASSTPPSSVRAGTTMRSARCAWGTASSVPSSTQPVARRRVARTAGDRRRAGGAAGQRGREDHVAGARRRAASGRAAPPSRSGRSGSAPSTRVAHSGTGATALPCASSSRQSSIRP